MWCILTLKYDIWWQQFQEFSWVSTDQILCTLNIKGKSRPKLSTTWMSWPSWVASWEPMTSSILHGERCQLTQRIWNNTCWKRNRITWLFIFHDIWMFNCQVIRFYPHLFANSRLLHFKIRLKSLDNKWVTWDVTHLLSSEMLRHENIPQASRETQGGG